jgi:hypothetical protein
MKNRFAAFVVGRRSVAAAVFEGLKLPFWQVRSFQANSDKAALAVAGFINYIIERCEIEAAGLEELPADLKTRMAELTDIVQNLLREHSIPVLTASDDVLFASYSHPPIYSRAVLRETALQIFPQLRESSSGKELLDAALLGLYFQSERLLSDY